VSWTGFTKGFHHNKLNNDISKLGLQSTQYKLTNQRGQCNGFPDSLL